MSDSVIVFSLLLATVGLGFAPVLLSKWMPLSARWALAILLVGVSIWLNVAMSAAPHPYHLLLLIPFWICWVLSALWLLKQGIDSRS